MTVQTPIPDYAAARRAMVDGQLRPEGVTDRGVLAAMGSIPREQFVPADSAPLAYGDRSLGVGGGRFMLAPAVLGQLLTEMAPKRGERALVVGAGSGYSAAVLAAIGCDVTALESAPEFVARARDHGIAVVEAPLAGGNEAGAPYDLILVEGAVETLPDALIAQLADGGRLGAGRIEAGMTRLIVGRKTAGAFGFVSIADAGIAALPGFSRPREFTF